MGRSISALTTVSHSILISVATTNRNPVVQQAGRWAEVNEAGHAYAQVQLDVESQKICTINTHLGLFAVTRLVYGVPSAPAIFQHIMEHELSGIHGCLTGFW